MARAQAVSATAPHPTEVGMPILESHSYKEFSSFPQVWTILQDRRGVMYMGVSGGEIPEYDGGSWRKIDVGMDNVRSLAMDGTGRVWVGGNGGFGYLAPDSKGTQSYVSVLEKVPEKDRNFTDVWQTLVTPQGMFFRSYEELFRWDGKTMHVWHAPAGSRFQALSMVRGHIYTDENGVGLEEIVGDELRPVPGGAAYANSIKFFLHPYDDGRIIVSERGRAALALRRPEGHAVFHVRRRLPEGSQTLHIHAAARRRSLPHHAQGGVVILTHDGKLRQIIDVSDGLLDPDALSAFQDRDGSALDRNDRRRLARGDRLAYLNLLRAAVRWMQSAIRDLSI